MSTSHFTMAKSSLTFTPNLQTNINTYYIRHVLPFTPNVQIPFSLALRLSPLHLFNQRELHTSVCVGSLYLLTIFTTVAITAISVNGKYMYNELTIEPFSYDLDRKTREQNRNNKETEIERFDWFIERIQTRVAFGWLSEGSGEKTSCPRTF